MEKFGAQEDISSAEVWFDPEAARSNEKLFLEKNTNPKWAKLAAAMIAISAIAGCDQKKSDVHTSEVRETTADSKAMHNSQEAAVETQFEESPDIEGVTEFGTWSTELVDKMREEYSRLENSDDAKMFVQTTAREFIEEYFKPRRAEIEKNFIGDVVRVDIEQDYRLIAANCKIAQKITQSAMEKFSIDDPHTLEGFAEVVRHATESASYAGQKRRQLQDNNGL